MVSRPTSLKEEIHQSTPSATSRIIDERKSRVEDLMFLCLVQDSGSQCPALHYLTLLPCPIVTNLFLRVFAFCVRAWVASQGSVKRLRAQGRGRI